MAKEQEMNNQDGSNGSGRGYFRSLDEIAQTPRFKEFLHREFPVGASEWSGASRRTVLKLLGASAALAGLASCRRWPAEELAPYAHKPVNRTDGVPVHYATATELGGVGIGLVATSYDGRPTKVDGNVNHPLSKGSSSTLVQASVLDLYDHDRSRNVIKLNKEGKRIPSTWAEFTEIANANIRKDGDGLVVLSEATRSPSVAALRKKLSKAKWFEYEAVSNDAQREAAKSLYGRPLRAVPQIDKADVIVAIEADLFGNDMASIKYSRDFAAGRTLRDSANGPTKTMNRLWCVESTFTNTGANADHRRGVKPSEVATVVAALLAELGGSSDSKLSAGLKLFVRKLAEDLNAHKGKAVVIAGDRASVAVHALVAAINEQIGAVGTTLSYYADPEDPRGEATWTPYTQQLKSFIAEAAAADALLVIGTNVVYTAPTELKIAEVLAKAKLSIHLGSHTDETARMCTWHVPQAHYLEAWGDVRTLDGTVSITQPLIEPIFGAKSAIEILSILAGEKKAGRDIVRETAAADYLAGRFTEWNWKKSLFDGVVANTARTPENPGKIAALPAASASPAGELELTFITDKIHDGRYANNGWLMELPDPMTRITWDNALLTSKTDADKLGIWNDDVVSLEANGTTVKATVYVFPGQPAGSLALALGYGRKAAGFIADQVVSTGTNAYLLRTLANYLYAPSVKITKTGEKNALASVQDHNVIDKVGAARKVHLIPELVVEGTFAEYVKKPALGTRKLVSLSMFNEHKYDAGHKWGMAIDLTTCTGCSACVVACQAENNIPIVGKRQVNGGREMHWLRIDRYFKHEGENTQAVHQPVMCVHCENAPCEEVCPVAATTHSEEGLNMMTYNRCIGTRYCSNNCPYKVRRFNFFDYNSGNIDNLYTPNLIRSDKSELTQMQKNPQVTVRSRGVMEKCTYCVQRIEVARIKVRSENRATADKARITDGMVQTACQQSCPAGAIVFGDLNDPNSRVSKLHAQSQSYGLLDPELNTKPRTLFLAKVRNPVEGLDADLYSAKDESEGFYWQQNSESGHEGHDHKHDDHDLAEKSSTTKSNSH